MKRSMSCFVFCSREFRHEQWKVFYCKYCEQDFTHSPKNVAAPFLENQCCILGANDSQVHFLSSWLDLSQATLGSLGTLPCFQLLKHSDPEGQIPLNSCKKNIWVLVFYKSEPVGWQKLAVGISADTNQPLSSASSLMHGHPFMSLGCWEKENFKIDRKLNLRN